MDDLNVREISIIIFYYDNILLTACGPLYNISLDRCKLKGTVPTLSRQSKWK